MAATLPLSVCAPVKPEMRNDSTSKVAQRPNQNFFQIANITEHVLAIRTQVDDRISDDLAGSVIGDLSSAICLKDTHVAFLQESCLKRLLRRLRERRPHRQSVRMLEQKQRVRLGARQNRALSLFLNGERRRVFNAA